MRIYNPLAGRPQYYDRTPVPRNLAYAAQGIAPHGAVARWTYTVPANKKFLLATLFAQLTRQTVATTAAFAQTNVSYTPNAGSPTQILLCEVLANTIDANRVIMGGGALALNAGDNISGFTGDTSTAGTMDYTNAMAGTEFDA